MNTVLNDALEKYARIDSRDRSLFVKLLHGTLEYQIQLDCVINRYSSVNTRKMKPLIRNVLRMTSYQIIYADKIPDSAAINESVKLVKNTSMKNLCGFVNAVARKISSEKKSISFSTREEIFSVKSWMLELLDASIGPEKTDLFLSDSLSEHGLSIRTVGTDKVSTLESVSRLTENDDWLNGRIIAQDYSSVQPVIRAGILPGNTVIDVCSSPGGKALQASEHTGPNGTVIACDLTEEKVDRIIQNIERLHVKNVKTLVCDARKYHKEFAEKADVVLADLPCSGIGTISGKPDIKNRLSLEDCLSLAELQLEILNNVSLYVKIGGRLVFSTCTLDHYENEDNVSTFLSTHDNYALDSMETIIKEGADGFFIAVFNRLKK